MRPAPTRLYLVRHGDVGVEGILHGHVDVPLTALGERQMARVAERLAAEPLAAVYSSDLSRSHQSAALVAAPHGHAPRPDPAFRELNMGRWDGRAFGDLWREERGAVAAWWADLASYRLPGGESLADLEARVLPALARLLATHRGETVCLVAHGGVNRVVLFDALGLPLGRFHSLGQDHACVNLLEVHADGARVVQLVNG